eukprot:gene18458-32957_t
MIAVFAAMQMEVPSAAAISRAIDGKHFLGYNVVNLQSGNFTTDAKYVASTADILRAGTLRYPGGNLADWWDWKAGWCIPETTAQGCAALKNPCANKQQRKVYKLEEFKIALDAAGAIAVLMMNLLTATLDDQMQYLQRAKNVGVLVEGTYVELGGEFYWGKYSCRWDRAADYAKDANAWAAEIKRQFPEVRIMAVAAHSIEMQAPNDRGSCWNTELYPLLSENIDGVVIHPYLHLTDPKTGGGPLQPGIPARTASEGPTGWYEYNDSKVQRLNADVIKSDSGAEMLFGVPFSLSTAAAGDVGTKTKLPDRFKMIVTEWNVMERGGPLHLSWAHALFVAAATHSFLQIPQMETVMLHCLLNGFGWGALYETDADFRAPFGGTPPEGSVATALGKTGCLLPECSSLVTVPYNPTAVGSVLGLLSTAMQNAAFATRLDDFPINPARTGGLHPSGLPGNVTYPSLLGWHFSSSTNASSNSNVTVVNLSPTPLPYAPCAGAGVRGGGNYNRGGSGSTSTTYTTMTSPAASGSLLAWASATPVTVVVGKTSPPQPEILLPPYSVTMFNLH